MPRLDLYPMPGRAAGYVVDVQADLLRDMSTRVVIPLVPRTMMRASITSLNPPLQIAGEAWVLLPQQIATVSLRALGETVGTLADQGERITRAIDFLFGGV